jgi:low affinity Fe/Cu permease
VAPTRFHRGLTTIGDWLGTPLAFGVATVFAALWIVFGDGMNWRDIATMMTVYITLLILRADRRDNQALQAKLDELLRAHEGARETFTRLDSKEPEEIERIRERENSAMG